MRLFGKGKSEADPLENLYPLIVPSTYIESGAWKLPHIHLKPADLILTWGVLHEEQTMIYVTAEQAEKWEKEKIN